MSLVVGEIHDGGVTLVADTKITWEDTNYPSALRDRHVFEAGNALPKLVILRDDLCVGVAGQDLVRVIPALVAMRDRPVDDITAFATNSPKASFVVAVLSDSPALWQVDSGCLEDRTAVGRAWVGVQAGYEIFQARYNEWQGQCDAAFRLLSSLQWLLEWRQVPSVGGYLTRVGTHPQGFRFCPDASYVFAKELQGLVSPNSLGGGTLTLPVQLSPDLHQTKLGLECAVGQRPTFGALAYLVTGSGRGLAILFPHATPTEPVSIEAETMAELLKLASQDYGQYLSAPSRPGPLSGF